MKFEIVKYTESHIKAVREFNGRLREGGSHYQFPESNIPEFAGGPEQPIYQEYFLAVSGNEVHGGYILKHQRFVIKGEEKFIGSFELPLSEGVVDRKYRSVALLLVFDCLKRQPVAFTAGLGGFDQPATRFLQNMGWTVKAIPFYFRINNPGRFLRNIKYLRRGVLKSIGLDILSYSGLGWLAVKFHQAVISRKRSVKRNIESRLTDNFGDWSDNLWNSQKARIFFSSSKDSEVLRTLYTRRNDDAIILKVRSPEGPVGWAVLKATKLENHRYFGNMKVGTIVDCFCRPGNEKPIISSATSDLEKQDVDLIVSNQSHREWCGALSYAGFMQGPSNYLFASSKALTAILDPVDKNIHEIHINRGNSGYWNF